MFTKEHIGRTVYDCVHFGEGTIVDFDTENSDYPVGVEFKNGRSCYYTEEGKHETYYLVPTLSFTPYTLEGYTNKPSKSWPEVGEEVLVSNDEVTWFVKKCHRVIEGNRIDTLEGLAYNYYKRFKEIE